MSFILDALKKSEHARQRQAGPALFEVKVVQPRRSWRPWVIGIALALLLVNALTLGWLVLGRHGSAARTTHPAASPPPAPAPAPTGHGETVAPVAHAAPSALSSAPPGGAPPAAAPPAQVSPETRATALTGAPTAARTATPPASNPADFEPALQPATPSTTPASGSLPLYAQIAAEPGSGLPRLHLDLHVYSSNPAQRFVMINMHKLRQGDALADGVSVVKIRPDGVVLSYQGREFLLPR